MLEMMQRDRDFLIICLMLSGVLAWALLANACLCDEIDYLHRRIDRLRFPRVVAVNGERVDRDTPVPWEPPAA